MNDYWIVSYKDITQLESENIVGTEKTELFDLTDGYLTFPEKYNKVISDLFNGYNHNYKISSQDDLIKLRVDFKHSPTDIFVDIIITNIQIFNSKEDEL